MSGYSGFSPQNFYGKTLRALSEEQENVNRKPQKCIIPYVPRDLLHGPNILWKVFRKQDEALDFMKRCNDGLMSFAFEYSGSGRLFLVAHPEVFWHYDTQRDSESRCTYEIITEFTACKIYVDLEFDLTLNHEHNGSSMVSVFIKILFSYLKEIFGVTLSEENVLNLDSTTSKKFSRHLIFNLSGYCFRNNYHVGHFIKNVCQNIRFIIKRSVVPDSMNNIFSIDDFKNLMVTDAKDSMKLFCDESVYSKNRHFRLYKSTKRGKNSNLVLSSENKFVAANELQYFLNSLVTNLNSSDVKVLEFSDVLPLENKERVKPHSFNVNSDPSPYPFVDAFIAGLVFPGKMYRNVFFVTAKMIVYDIVGNRFCGNIGREHKSNNVKYIVDLKECVYYQKCHDYECAHYRSEKKSLPGEITFKLTDNSDMFGTNINNQGVFGLSPNDAEQILDAIEAAANDPNFEKGTQKNLKKFPSFGLSDEDFLNVNY